MTMNVSADAVDGIPAVTSSGSCGMSVTSNGGGAAGGGCDGASVGSNSTKTRFSFYNAQEVQMDEQNHQATHTTNNATTSSSRGREGGEETAKSAPTETTTASSHRSPSKNNGAPTSGANASDQRFNFYVSDEVSASSSSSLKAKTEERRSPHALLAAEEDKSDNKRTPAVGGGTTSVTGSGVEATAAASSSKLTATGAPLSVKTSASTPTTTTQSSSTPQRSNTLSASAQKKKQRAVQAAAARARSHTNTKSNDPNVPPTGTTPLSTNTNNPKESASSRAGSGSSSSKTKQQSQVATLQQQLEQQSQQEEQQQQEQPSSSSQQGTTSNVDSVEILRSLKDTEQMRHGLMKECHPKHHHHQQKGYNGSNSSATTHSDAASSRCSSADSATQESHQDAAEALSIESQPEATAKPQVVCHHHHQQQQQGGEETTTTTTTRSMAHQDHQHALQRPAGTIAANASSAAAPGGGGGGNPHEDAIREALGLLRKHRPPSPSHPTTTTTAVTATTAMDHDNAVGGATAGACHHTQQQQQQHLSIDMNAVHGEKLIAPGDADRVLQSRWESPHDHLQQEELDARRKERQERMARHTSRLAEMKGGEDATNANCQVCDDNLHRPASTIEEGDDESRLSAADPSTALDELVNASAASCASSSSQQQQQQPTPPGANAGAGGIIPVAACASEDLASLDTASSLSASNCNPQGDNNNQKEVHRSVERVLLAVLERAHSNGRGSQANNAVPPAGEPSPVEEKKSATEDRSSAGGVFVGSLIPGSIQQQQQMTPLQQLQPPTDEDDPLLRAVGELLSSSGGASTASASSPLRPLASDNAEQSSLTSGAKRSVVEELLAEAESFGDLSNLSHSRNPTAGGGGPGSGSQSSNNERTNPNKRGEDLLNCSAGVEAVRSDTDMSAVAVDKELDDPVPKTLGKSPSKGENNPETFTDGDDETGDCEEEETQSQSGSHEEEEEDEHIHDSCEDDEDSQADSDDDDDLDDALEGALGPLSKTAGGTTGVALESNFAPTSPDRSSGGERSIFDSLSNAMSSLVASAISGDDKQPIPSIETPKATGSGRDKCATDMDSDDLGDDGEEQSSGTSEDLDEEASELMRTLCAHLLPFGVDQSSRFLDEVPQWDDSNPNEAGHRIMRLTNQQLERVERAFEAMVHAVKKNSEDNLLDRGQPEGSTGDIDASFERDSAVAEKALDREEENRSAAILKALKLDPNKDAANETEKGSSTGLSRASESDTGSVDGSVASAQAADQCHPDFPGVHSAGKGEMGDLECFHLPVIFKSHVTGFEPAKDLFLEPGNVVAGQCLVESELGSAAFSTACRCVDLNSEGGDTDDGHQEVCLKVIKNAKDFFDQSLDEIKILELLRQTGQCQQNNIIEMKTFFYHREHLIIVTELLRQNLFEFGKFILDHGEEPHFTLPRLGCITRQCLTALRFVHNLGLVHSDAKPENILLGSCSRAQVKLIDFGSSCCPTDRQSSCTQSRSHRAPEVVLGLPHDGKIDVWSLGCAVAEMLAGEATFQNDSIVSMSSRIEAICGPFPRHMIAQGRQSCRFFTKCGLLFEKVAGEDGRKTPDASEDEDDPSMEGRRRAVFDIFQPKVTAFASRLGFPADLQDGCTSGVPLSPIEEKQAQFVDFVRKLLTIDPDGRPSASEALQHPWMVHAASLTEEDIKCPSQQQVKT